MTVIYQFAFVPLWQSFPDSSYSLQVLSLQVKAFDKSDHTPHFQIQVLYYFVNAQAVFYINLLSV